MGYDNRSEVFQSRPFYTQAFDKDDHVLSPVLPDLLRTISHLNSLTITGSKLDWNSHNPSLKSAFLHLMHLPTVNNIELSFIQNFPLSTLTPSVNLLRLDIFFLCCPIRPEEDGSLEFVVQLQIMPKLREFHTSESTLLTTKLLHAKSQNGQPAFNLTHLKQLSISFNIFDDERNIRYLLQNAKSLEKLHLSVGNGRSLEELNDILSTNTRTLRALDLTVIFPACRALRGIGSDGGT